MALNDVETLAYKNTGFEIKNYISRTHEMKNRILSKKGACSSFFQKYIDCPNITRCLP